LKKIIQILIILAVLFTTSSVAHAFSIKNFQPESFSDKVHSAVFGQKRVQTSQFYAKNGSVKKVTCLFSLGHSDTASLSLSLDEGPILGFSKRNTQFYVASNATGVTLGSHIQLKKSVLDIAFNPNKAGYSFIQLKYAI